MNTEGILQVFSEIEASITRARLPFETGMLQDENVEASLYELIKSWKRIENLVREIAPERFGQKRVVAIQIQMPPLDHHQLAVCPYCGDPKCTSDHK